MKKHDFRSLVFVYFVFLYRFYEWNLYIMDSSSSAKLSKLRVVELAPPFGRMI